MKKQELYDRVIAYFEQAMPVAETELHYHDPFQLLVAVILSAQCTGQTGQHDYPSALPPTTPLRKPWPPPRRKPFYEYIRSVSYPNNKAKHLVGDGAHAGGKLPQRGSFRFG